MKKIDIYFFPESELCRQNTITTLNDFINIKRWTDNKQFDLAIFNIKHQSIFFLSSQDTKALIHAFLYSQSYIYIYMYRYINIYIYIYMCVFSCLLSPDQSMVQNCGISLQIRRAAPMSYLTLLFITPWPIIKLFKRNYSHILFTCFSLVIKWCNMYVCAPMSVFFISVPY